MAPGQDQANDDDSDGGGGTGVADDDVPPGVPEADDIAADDGSAHVVASAEFLESAAVAREHRSLQAVGDGGSIEESAGSSVLQAYEYKANLPVLKDSDRDWDAHWRVFEGIIYVAALLYKPQSVGGKRYHTFYNDVALRIDKYLSIKT